MKRKLFILTILFTGFMLFGLTSNQAFGQTTENKYVKSPTVEYTCTKHPEINQKLPGNCPICGLRLVERKKESKTTTGKMTKHPKVMGQDSVKVKKV